MIQRHAILLWKKAEREDKNFEEISKETYEILNLFQDYPRELQPYYLTVKSNKDIKKFNWSYENFSRYDQRSVRKTCAGLYAILGMRFK